MDLAAGCSQGEDSSPAELLMDSISQNRLYSIEKTLGVLYASFYHCDNLKTNFNVKLSISLQNRAFLTDNQLSTWEMNSADHTLSKKSKAI